MKPASSRKTLPCGRPAPKPAADGRDAPVLLREMSERLDRFAASEKLNRSETRAKILETIVLHARHFTPKSLLERLREMHPEIGRATLYRNLPILVRSGIIQEGPTGSEGQTLYELSTEEHHDHIVCLDCDQIFEFHDDSIERKQHLVSKKLGFTPRAHRHIVYARCDYLDQSAVTKD